jgi:hypothetical protein
MRCVACLICFVLGWRNSTLYEAISEKPLVMMVSCQCLGPSGWASHRRFYSCSPLPALRDGCHYQPPIKDSQRHIDLAYEGLQGLLLSKTAAHAAEFLCRHARHSTTSTHPEAVIRFSQSSQRLVAKATQNLSGRFSMIYVLATTSGNLAVSRFQRRIAPSFRKTCRAVSTSPALLFPIH